MADLKSLLGDKYTEGMTIEDVLALDVEAPKADTTEYDKLKKRFDEVASELASSKKQLRANMTEAEQKALADAELLEAVTLQVDESTLTGEPVCGKTTNIEEFDKEATFPSNHVMRGTKVMEGHGVCRVFAVGDKTENGKVFENPTTDYGIIG